MIAVIPKPLLIYKNPNNIPAINRTAKASGLSKNDSSPIKWNEENKIEDKNKAKNCVEKWPMDLKMNLTSR